MRSFIKQIKELFLSIVDGITHALVCNLYKPFKEHYRKLFVIACLLLSYPLMVVCTTGSYYYLIPFVTAAYEVGVRPFYLSFLISILFYFIFCYLNTGLFSKNRVSFYEVLVKNLVLLNLFLLWFPNMLDLGWAFSNIQNPDLYPQEDFPVENLLVCISGLSLNIVFYNYNSLKHLNGVFGGFLLVGLVWSINLLITSKTLFHTMLCIEAVSLIVLFLGSFLPREDSLAPLLFYYAHNAIAGVLLFGGLFFYFLNDSLTEITLAEAAKVFPTQSPAFLVGSLLIIFGIFTKAGVCPGHTWVPNLYKKSPLIFINVLNFVKAPLLFLVIKVSKEIFNNSHKFGQFAEFFEGCVIISACVSIIYGVSIGIRENRLKGILASSSIVTHGTFMLAVMLQETHFFYAGLAIYISYYISLTWFTVQFYKLESQPETIQELQKFLKDNPWQVVTMFFSLSSFAGLPPFLGGVSKIYFIYQLFCSGYTGLGLFLLIASLLSSYYYFDLIGSFFGFLPNCPRRKKIYFIVYLTFSGSFLLSVAFWLYLFKWLISQLW